MLFVFRHLAAIYSVGKLLRRLLAVVHRFRRAA